MKQIKVIVNGKPYEVEVGDLSSSPLAVTVNGQSYTVEIETMGGEMATSAPVAVAVAPVKVAAAAPVVASPKATPPPAVSGNEVRAPMPGVILDIAVKAGDKVSVSQQLCALEAMKMKNAIRSPRQGVIAGVHVNQGQKVAFGDILVSFE